MASSCQGSIPSVTKLLIKTRSLISYKDRIISDCNFDICDIGHARNKSSNFSAFACIHSVPASRSTIFIYPSRYAGDIHMTARHSDIKPGLTAFQQIRKISGHSTKSSPTRYYDILGLSPNATQHQIKSAYYNMSKLYHPDVSKGAKNHTMFTEITEAYEVLGNLRKRRMYDRGIYTRNSTVHSTEDDTGMDYTAAYQQKARASPFERGDRPPPPRGRSNVYNFDEFYRQHYNEIRERRAHEYKEFIRHQENMRGRMSNAGEDLYYRKQNPMALLVAITALIFLGTVAMSLENYDRDLIGTSRAGVSHPNYYGFRDSLRNIPITCSDEKDQDSK